MIYTIGYDGKSFEEMITQLKKREVKFLFDIRFRPFSYNFQYNSGILNVNTNKEGMTYLYIPELGNINYKDSSLPIVIQNIEAGMEKILPIIQKFKDKPGYSFALLCACLNYNYCHRKVVAGLLQEKGYPTEEIEYSKSDTLKSLL